MLASGPGDQRRVRLRTNVIHSTFHPGVLRCREAGVALHPSCPPLGLSLACPYEHRARLGVAPDVRAAFDAAAPDA